jgi:hypothetical protein
VSFALASLPFVELLRNGALDDARVVIGGHARVVSPDLAAAVVLQLRRGTPVVAIPLE